MIRAAFAPSVLTSLALLAFSAPAEAALQSCVHSGDTVTATFVSNVSSTQSTLQQVGSEIRFDGAQCNGTATTANTDTIDVVGANDIEEVLVIDLSGGTFFNTGGADLEAGTSDEIEINLDLGTEGFVSNFNQDVSVFGTTGVDRVTVGLVDQALPAPDLSRINLNAGEADGIDADVLSNGSDVVNVSGFDNNDVLDASGADGTGGTAASLGSLFGGTGDDTITIGRNVSANPGDDDDTITAIPNAPFREFGTISYSGAPGPVTLTLQDGTGGQPGGGTATGLDGYGDTDTYFGAMSRIDGSSNGDTLNGGPLDDVINGRGGVDTVNGNGGPDNLRGDGGGDFLNGGGDDDLISGDADGDTIHGDAGADRLNGSAGTDVLFGDGDDDILGVEGQTMSGSDPVVPDGNDTYNGGAGIDTIQYADPERVSSFPPLARASAVSVDFDGIADDGAPGENDNVMPDVENAVGGSGNDTLTGNVGPNVLFGFGGADVLRGGGGDDMLRSIGVRGPFADEADFDDAGAGDDFDGEAGADTIGGQNGDDTIAARDGTADTIGCGSGNDTGLADTVDTINADCEGIALPVQMPPDPPVAPPADPPVTPPPPPPVTPPVVTPPATPTLAQLVSLPSTRRCVSRRRFRVRVRSTIRGEVTRVTIFINGKRVKRVTGTRIGLPIDLRGLPKGRIRVRLRVELTGGRVRTDTRTYRTCATKKRRGRFG